MARGEAPASRPPMSTLDRALAAGLLVLLALRFIAIEQDPPGGIVSSSGVFLTDEGHYLTPAKLYHTFGTWRTEQDFNWHLAAPLYSLLTAAMGYVFDPLLIPARCASVAFSAAGILVFYAICRRARSRAESLVCCLLAAASFDNFTYSRLALMEPLGTLLGLTALYLWVSWRGHWLGVAASGLLAAGAVTVKANLVYTPAAVGILWLADAAVAWRGGLRRKAAATLGVFAAAACVPALAWLAAARHSPDVQQFHSSAGIMANLSSLGGVLANEAQLLWFYPQSSWRRVFVLAALLGAVWWAVGGRKPSGQTPQGTEGRVSARPLAAMALWGGLGWVFFGALDYQVPRWLYFTIYPCAYLVVSLLVRVVPTGRRAAVLALLVAGHVLSQAPAVCRYAARPHKTSLLDAARAVAREVKGGGAAVPVLGNCAHLAALFSNHIRPLTTTIHRPGELRDRVRYWRPAYFVGLKAERELFRDECRGLIAAARPIASYTVMDNYYDGTDLMLYQLEYK